MNQEKQTSEFRQRIKAHIADANKNHRPITPELKIFIDMLYQYHISPKCTKEQSDILREEDANVPRSFFLFFINKDASEKASICINVKKKNLYSIVSSLSELKDINVFMSVGTFYLNGNNISRGKSPFRRIKGQASRINFLFSDLDFYHMKDSRFEGLTPEEVLVVMKQEKPELFDGSLPVTVVKSGNGLQVYLLTESIPVNIKRWYHFWKITNQRFNELFLEYGSDSHCSGDVSRIFRLPETFNCKKEPIKVEFLTEVATKPLDTEKLLEFLNLTPEDTKPPKSKKELAKEKADTKYAKKLQELMEIKSQKEKERHERGEFEKWMQEATLIEFTARQAELKRFSEMGKKGFTALTRKRLKDFETILERDDYEMEGKRNMFLFIYGITYHSYYRDEDKLLLKLLEMNELFQEPLDENEVELISRHIDEGGYNKLTNQYIVNVLQLTAEDVETLSISYTEKQRLEKERLRGKVKYSSKFEGGITPTRKRMDKNALIILNHSHLPNTVLMEMTGLKSTAFYKLKKKIKEGILPTKIQ